MRDEACIEVPNGVHLDLPFEDYLAIPALSSTDLKAIDADPINWKFARPDNPLWTPPKPSTGQLLGTACHTALLEGVEAFARAYKRAFRAPAGVLTNRDDMKEALDAAGVSYRKSAKKDDLAAIVREHLPEAVFIDDARAAHDADPREEISEDWEAIIHLLAKQVNAHKVLAPLFAQGLPEVTVVWSVGGRRFKARFDLVHPLAMVDLKTSSKIKGRDKRWSIVNEITNYGYHMQAAWYLHARRKMRGADVHFHGDRSLDAYRLAQLDKFIDAETVAWAWVYATTIDCPQIYVLELTDPLNHPVIREGRQRCGQAIKTLRAWERTQGEDALWFDVMHWADDGSNMNWPDGFQRFPVAARRPSNG